MARELLLPRKERESASGTNLRRSVEMAVVSGTSPAARPRLLRVTVAALTRLGFLT